MEMTQPRRRRGELRAEDGAALLTTVIILGMLTALAAAYAANVRSHVALRGASSVERLGFYTAEGGLNVGVTRFANIFREAGVPEGSDFHQEIAIAARTADVTLAAVDGCDPCPPTVVPQGELFAGLNSIPYRYTVQSLSLNDAGETEAHVAGEFDIHTVPIFQFLAFIDDHLFIMPLPNMTLHGRLHSNNRIYLQPDNTLKVEDLRPLIPEVQVTASDRIYRGGRKYDSSWNCHGTVTIDKLEDKVLPKPDLDPKTMSCGTGTGPVSDATLASWKGSIKQEVTNIVTPDVGIINRGGSEYWENAELRVVLRLDQPRAAIDFGAADLCPGGWGTCSVTPATPCDDDTDCPAGEVCTRLSPALYPIEVQHADGSQDAEKTRALLRFLCERRGALFYTDVPVNPPSPPNGDSAFVANVNNYVPPFIADNRVYRRVGEDTSGNGILSNNIDRNDDTCPPGVPWYQPPDCNQIALGRPQAGNWYFDLDYRRGAFWNHRELQYMYLLNVNVRALIEWNQVNGDPLFDHEDETHGGLVWFLSVAGPNEAANVNNYAVRVFDSADLDTRNETFPPGVADPTGLTIVSDQGIIIQGNYNYKDKYPAAIVSDAQWVLSQGWETPIAGFLNDQKSVFDLATGNRDVPATDWPGTGNFSTSTALGVNAALLFGLGPSTRDPDWYNGGLENFPRFLESWNNRTMNYRGSFVSLGRARHKLANWPCGSGVGCYAGVYDPPVRAYDYDGDFNTVEKLPPMTPKIVYVQQLLYTRIFN
jgi:hypothetical protein